jgi:hypothetical protein
MSSFFKLFSLIFYRIPVIDAIQTGPKKANSTLNKTIKMRYDAQVYNHALLAKATGMSQE